MDYIDYTLNELSKSFELEKLDIGEYHKIDKSMMHFVTDSYIIKGVGKLSIMRMKAMLGLMKMSSLIITPLEVEMPLYSSDLISAIGNQSDIFELYNTKKETPSFPSLVAIQEKYKAVEDYPSEPNWYDDIRLKETIRKKDKKQKAEMEELSKEYISEYISLLKKAEKPTDLAEKRKLTQNYVNTLIEKGGPAVNQFKKLIGEEKTGIFLRKYFFGSED